MAKAKKKQKVQKIIGQPMLNGKPIDITSSWDDMNFSQYLRVLKMGKDTAETISIITGIDRETIKKAKIQGLDKILYISTFLNHPPNYPKRPTQIDKYKLPLNSKGVFEIQFESLEQFEDMRKLMPVVNPEDPDRIYKITEAYATYCALYLQKLRDGEYNGSEALKMVPNVMHMKAREIVPAGSFFFIKLLSLSIGIIPNSRNTAHPRKKRTGKGSRKPSGHMQRLTKYRAK